MAMNIISGIKFAHLMRIFEYEYYQIVLADNIYLF